MRTAALALACLVVAFVVVVLLSGCLMLYSGDPRVLQPMCIIKCDATAAKIEGIAASSAGSINQTDESQGPLSNKQVKP